MGDIKKCRSKVLLDSFMMFLVIPFRINFLQMSRYGLFSDKTYRKHFEKRFNFFSFNTHLTNMTCGKERFIALDPSYLPKSGKKTYGLSKYWSGVAGEAKKGLEITGLAVIDVVQKAAYHLEALQTPSLDTLKQAGKTLVIHYLDLIVQRATELKQIADYLVVDAYFAKETFVSGLLETTSLHLISRLRCDANMQYLYQGEQRKGRGRPKTYDGKVDWKNINLKHFSLIITEPTHSLYEAILYSKAFKRNVKVAYLQLKDVQGIVMGYRIFFSTDLQISGQLLFDYYRLRFQQGRLAIEFLFRDAKQYAGLTQSQAISENKIYMHVNFALTSISLARVMHWKASPTTIDNPFSMKNIKVLYFNQLLVDRIFTMFGIEPNLIKNQEAIQKITSFGARAA